MRAATKKRISLNRIVEAKRVYEESFKLYKKGKISKEQLRDILYPFKMELHELGYSTKMTPDGETIETVKFNNDKSLIQYLIILFGPLIIAIVICSIIVIYMKDNNWILLAIAFLTMSIPVPLWLILERIWVIQRLEIDDNIRLYWGFGYDAKVYGLSDVDSIYYDHNRKRLKIIGPMIDKEYMYWNNEAINSKYIYQRN